MTTETSDQGQVTSHDGTGTKWSLVPKTSHPIGDDLSDEMEVWPSDSFEACNVMTVLVW